MVPISKVTLSVAVQHNKELEKQQAAIQQVMGLAVCEGMLSVPHCVSFCSQCTQHEQLQPVFKTSCCFICCASHVSCQSLACMLQALLQQVQAVCNISEGVSPATEGLFVSSLCLNNLQYLQCIC